MWRGKLAATRAKLTRYPPAAGSNFPARRSPQVITSLPTLRRAGRIDFDLADHCPPSCRPRHHHRLLCDGPGHRLLPEEIHEERRGLFPGGPGDVSLGGGAEFSVRQPRRPGVDGLGGGGLSVRDTRRALVL